MNSTILIVDDDQSLLNGIKRVLHREPYELKTARCAPEAFAVLKSCSINLVISDEKMPGINGTVLLARIAEEYPQCKRVMLTGATDIGTAIRAINDGHIDRFLSKPCNDLTLVNVIRELLAVNNGGK